MAARPAVVPTASTTATASERTASTPSVRELPSERAEDLQLPNTRPSRQEHHLPHSPYPREEAGRASTATGTRAGWVQEVTQPIDVSCMMNVVRWATEAATENVRRHGTLDFKVESVAMSLWKDFQVAFPKDTTPGDYEVYVTLYCSVYSEVVRALIAR